MLAGEGDARVELGLEAIADRVPGEGPDEAFARAMRTMIDDGRPEETALGRLRYRMALEAPTVRANMLRRRREAERQLVAALLEQFLDELGADATVAAVMAATYAAAITSLTRGRSMESIQDAMHRAVEIGMWGHRRNG